MSISYDQLWIVFAMTFFVGAVVKWLWIRRLRECHRDAWEKIGSPTLWNGNLSRFMAELGFLFKLRFITFGDTNLTALGIASLIVDVALLFLFLALWVNLFGLWH